MKEPGWITKTITSLKDILEDAFTKPRFFGGWRHLTSLWFPEWSKNISPTNRFTSQSQDPRPGKYLDEGVVKSMSSALAQLLRVSVQKHGAIDWASVPLVKLKKCPKLTANGFFAPEKSRPKAVKGNKSSYKESIFRCKKDVSHWIYLNVGSP